MRMDLQLNQVLFTLVVRVNFTTELRESYTEHKDLYTSG